MQSKSKIHAAAQYFLNHHLEADELRRQISMLAKCGYETIYAHARAGLETPYFSKKWYDAIQIIIDQCEKENIKFSIWDEDGYPSLVAGNRIMWEHTELRAQELAFFTRNFQPGERVFWKLPCDGRLLKGYAVSESGKVQEITEFFGTLRGSCSQRKQINCGYSPVNKIPAPHWRTWCEEKMFALDWDLPDDGEVYTVIAICVINAPGRHNTDIFNPETTEIFLKITHESYLKKFPEAFKNHSVYSTFMDEPSPGGMFPWSKVMPEAFFDMHHFDLLENLLHLAINVDEKSAFIRQCYRETQHQLQCHNYLVKMQSWCSQHQISSIGHLSRSECLSYAAAQWPNELRCYKYMDLPCTDPLGLYIGTPGSSAYHAGCKVVSSAARLFQQPQCGSDAFAVMGNETSIRDLDFSLNFQLAMGITFFNLHNLAYSLDGFRKDEAPPSLFYQHSEWPHFKFWLKSLKEKCQKLEEGKPVRKILLLYPSTSLQVNFLPGQPDIQLEKKFHDFVESLLKRQKDFDFIDEITLQEKAEDLAALRNDYEVLILFSLSHIKKSTAQIAEAFAESNGQLFVLEQIPALLGDYENPQQVWENCTLSATSENWYANLPGAALVGENSEDIFINCRELTSGIKRYFLFNRAKNRTFCGHLNQQSVSVPPGEAVFVNENPPDAVPEKILKKDTILTPSQLVLPENFLALPFWTYGNSSCADRHNLLERDFFTFTQAGDTAQTTFLWNGDLPKTFELVWESDAVNGDFEIFFNNILIDDFKRKTVRDCQNYCCNIADKLIHSAYPELNILEIRASKIGIAMPEMPFLHGSFRAEFPHGTSYQPNLCACNGVFNSAEILPDWRNSGYATFSGTGVYEFNFELKTHGRYQLFWQGLFDSAVLILNGKILSCLWQIDGSYDLGELAIGSYQLKLQVANAPGNRDQCANRPAGLIGKLHLQEYELKN